VPTGPAASTPSLPIIQNPSSPGKGARSTQTDGEQTEQEAVEGENAAPSKDKFFVVKSLTVEDLELSVRNGIWSTQSHNEEALNQAFKVCGAFDNLKWTIVILI
jgi:hypothetical protein